MYLGIEIGGTKLQLGLGEGAGVLKGLWRGTVDVTAGADGIRQQITAAVPELLVRAGVDRAQVRGVGIGFGGPVDDRTHTVIKSHQIEDWDNFPLADWLSDLLGLPAVLGNDADVAGLAEALFGAGKGLSPIFYITIGSGIGGGLVIDGEIYRGCGRGAAEIGHLRVQHPEREDLDLVTIESLGSGWGIEDQARYALRIGAETRIADLTGAGSVTVPLVAQAARGGDRVASTILEDARWALAQGVNHVIALLCPRRIIIGGGVAQLSEDLLFAPLRKLVAEQVFKPFADCYDIVPAALGEEVVVHGALALARQRLGE